MITVVCKSAAWFKCLRVRSAAAEPAKTADQSSVLRPDCPFIPLKRSLLQSQTSKKADVKQGSEATGSSAVMKHTPQLSCQMLKMGSSGHSGSTQGVYARKVVEAGGD